MAQFGDMLFRITDSIHYRKTVPDIFPQETMNYWKQLPHILKYFRADEDPNAKRPKNFMAGFLEVSLYSLSYIINNG